MSANQSQTIAGMIPANDPGAPARLTDYRTFSRMGYAAIALAFGGFGVWASTAPLDSAAVAPSQVAVTSDKKPIQHLEGGIMREVLVTESQKVKQGQVLFRLQPVQAQSNADLLRKQLDAAMAQEARLLAERSQQLNIAFAPELEARRGVPETAAAMLDQERQFAERRRTVEQQVNIHLRRIDQTKNDIQGKMEREASLQAQSTSLREDIERIRPIAAKGFFPKNRLSERERELMRINGELGGARGDIARSKQIIAEAQVQIELIRQQQVTEVSQQLGEVRVRLSDMREKLQVAADVLSRVEVRAPQDGIVQGIKVHVVGAVVRPGEPLAEIVTLDDGLIMTAKVQPSDIDSVQAGQKAEIRFPAFTSKQTQATLGKVETVSADIMIDPGTKQPYYLARVSIDASTLPSELRDKLIPGMQATVLITTGERTLLKFLVGPLTDKLARVMRER